MKQTKEHFNKLNKLVGLAFAARKLPKDAVLLTVLFGAMVILLFGLHSVLRRSLVLTDRAFLNVCKQASAANLRMASLNPATSINQSSLHEISRKSPKRLRENFEILRLSS